jgi:ribonuclease VapC
VIVDASAILAVLFKENGFERCEAALATGRPKYMSAVNYWEAAARMDSVTGSVDGRVDRLLEAANVTVVDVTPEHARLAREAWLRFGKGRHPARLNMGDCFAFALAAERGEPLLFKGDDFARTDLASAS